MAKTGKLLKYTPVAVALHWLIGLIVIFQIPYGHYAHGLERGTEARLAAYQFHESLGIIVLLLMVLRIIWRLTHPAPDLLPGQKRWEKITTKAVHHGFYLILILQPLAGWATMSTSSSAPALELFGVIPWFKLTFLRGLSEGREAHVFFENVHIYLGWLLVAMITIHVLAVLKHTFISKDDTLKRMLP